MLYKLEQHGKATLFYWQHGAGPLRQLGTYGEVAEMAYAVIDYFSGKNPAPIPDLPEQLAEATPCYTLPEAVSAAFRPWLDTSERRLSDSIRSAARHGRIAGAYKTPEGYWRLPVAAFNAWVASYSEQRRGRPRKEAAAVAPETKAKPEVTTEDLIALLNRMSETTADIERIWYHGDPPKKETAPELKPKPHLWNDGTPTVNVGSPEYQRIDPMIADAKEGKA